MCSHQSEGPLSGSRRRLVLPRKRHDFAQEETGACGDFGSSASSIGELGLRGAKNLGKPWRVWSFATRCSCLLMHEVSVDMPLCISRSPHARIPKDIGLPHRESACRAAIAWPRLWSRLICFSLAVRGLRPHVLTQCLSMLILL